MKKIFLLLVVNACAYLLYAQGSLQLGTGASINTSGGAYIVLNDLNIVNNGSIVQTGGDGFVKMTGNLNVSVSGSGSTNLNTLLLEKIGAAIVHLQSNLVVVSKVNFSGGLLNLNNSVLNLGSTGIFSNESESSRAFTTGSGYIEASGILNAPSSFDVGHLGAVITSSADLGNTIIRRGHAVQAGVFGSNNSIQRFYDIIPTNNINLKAVLRFYYFDAELNAINEASLHQWKSKDNTNWDFVGADGRDLVTNYVEKKSINKFDRWTLATATAPTITCPDNITTSANQNGCKALVSFAATTAAIPDATIIYRIANKVITSPYVFSRGTTTVTATASNGIAPDATCTFTVTVVCGSVAPLTKIAVPKEELHPIANQLIVFAYPNPSANSFSVSVQAPANNRITMQVTDVLGRVIETKNITANSVTQFGEQYRPGTYFVRIINGKQHKELKLIKLSD